MTKTEMSNKAKHELERQKLDLELDRQLEATFPASDALKITLRQLYSSETWEHSKIKKD